MNKQPAPLKKRFLALILDYFVILGYAICLFGVTTLFYTLVFGSIPDVLNMLGRGGSQLLGFTTLTLPMGLYFYFTESGHSHATFGKRAAKIKIRSLSSARISKQQVIIRTITKLLPWEFAHTFVYQIVYYSQNNGTPPSWVMVGLAIANILPIAYLGLVIFRKDHRGPHDLMARTLVIPAK